MSKILYGQVHPRTDFDEVVRIRGTQTRIARKGIEWFLLNASFRVVGIARSKEKAVDLFQSRRRNYGGEGELRLHNIEDANHGRCSKAKCKEIFDSVKRS
jgi:hypothetical protein